MDTRDTEAEVQRLSGYQFIVTSGLATKGPYLDFNSGPRQLRIWIQRDGTDVKKVAEMAKAFMKDSQEPAYKSMEYDEKAE